MLFLIDENLPQALEQVFSGIGTEAKSVLNMPALRGKKDEDIFDYALENEAVLVTRDLGFTNTEKFPSEKLQGLVVIRFPNEISVPRLCEEIAKLIEVLLPGDFKGIIVLEPAVVRKRKFIK